MAVEKIIVNSPPEEGLVDKLTKFIKAGVDSAVPFAAVGTELLMSFIKMPYQKRSQEWQQQVTDALNELQSRGIDLNELQNNEDFIDILLQAVPIGLKHHQQEKRRALKCAILSSASDKAPDISLQQMFLSCIDTFTVWHIKVLFLLSHPGNWFKEQKIGSPIIGMTGTLRRIIETAYPDLHAQRDFVEYICEDLFNKGFLKDGRGALERGLSANTLMQKCTTNMGDQFINYISKD